MYNYPCRGCGCYDYCTKDCPVAQDRRDREASDHRRKLESIARASAPASRLERIATAIFARGGISAEKAIAEAKQLSGLLDMEQG